MLIVVAAALLIALPSCNNEGTITPGPVAPTLEKVCFELGDPARDTVVELLTPSEGQPLYTGSNLLIAWERTELNGACGTISYTVEATYHNNPSYRIFDRDTVADHTLVSRADYTIPDLAPRDNRYDKSTCDLVCFWVTVHDEVGPVGDPIVIPIGPILGKPTPHRIPQEWVEP